MRKINRRYDRQPSRRFPPWFTSSSGFAVRWREDLPDRPSWLRLYVKAPGIGTYWLTWSAAIGRFIGCRDLERMRKRYPEQLEPLAAEIRSHLEELAHAG